MSSLHLGLDVRLQQRSLDGELSGHTLRRRSRRQIELHVRVQKRSPQKRSMHDWIRCPNRRRSPRVLLSCWLHLRLQRSWLLSELGNLLSRLVRALHGRTVHHRTWSLPLLFNTLPASVPTESALDLDGRAVHSLVFCALHSRVAHRKILGLSLSFGTLPPFVSTERALDPDGCAVLLRGLLLSILPTFLPAERALNLNGCAVLRL